MFDVEQEECRFDLWLFILDPVCLIDDHVPPVEFFEKWFLLDDHLIGSDADVPLTGHYHISDHRSLHNVLNKIISYHIISNHSIAV